MRPVCLLLLLFGWGQFAADGELRAGGGAGGCGTAAGRDVWRAWSEGDGIFLIGTACIWLVGVLGQEPKSCVAELSGYSHRHNAETGQQPAHFINQ